MSEAVLRIGEVRFGPPSLATRQAIKAIGEPERLEAILERVLRCASWEELVGGV
jgi:hypothetical protein